MVGAVTGTADPARASGDTPGIDVALRRVLLGLRVVGALWLTLLALALAVPVAPRTAWVSIAGAAVWTGVTLVVASRHALRAWPFVAADIAVAAATIVGPQFAVPGIAAFYGGYPFTALAVAAYARGYAGALLAAFALAAATVTRSALSRVGGAPPDVWVNAFVFYAAAAALLVWGLRVILDTDARLRAAQDALADERAARVRSQERAETAAHLHDSVLQTLALIQRNSDDAAHVTALARGQERELRAWLAAPEGAQRQGPGMFAAAVAGAAADVEERHRATVDVVTVGDAPLDDDMDALVAATREAMVNAARHGGGVPVSVYAEVSPRSVDVFVRDRGAGFDLERVDEQRRGIRESIVGRVQRHGGHAAIRSSPGEGTEVALTLPRPEVR